MTQRRHQLFSARARCNPDSPDLPPKVREPGTGEGLATQGASSS
jgi:hypothetical protein